MRKQNNSGYSNTVADGVDLYLAKLPEDIQTLLNNLRRVIKSAAPKAEEIISYKIPTYKYYGPLVHFMAGKSHCSFITVSKNIPELFKSELKPFKVSGTTIHFTADNPIPSSLIRKIVKTRIMENEMASINSDRKK
jgi:uncharacterized protein YdhG (YjbR/CyaY superfamily)